MYTQTKSINLAKTYGLMTYRTFYSLIGTTTISREEGIYLQITTLDVIIRLTGASMFRKSQSKTIEISLFSRAVEVLLHWKFKVIKLPYPISVHPMSNRLDGWASGGMKSEAWSTVRKVNICPGTLH